MDIRKLLETRKCERSGSAERDLAFVSTLFNTQSLQALAQHRSLPTALMVASHSPATEAEDADKAVLQSPDFRQWLENLSRMQTNPAPQADEGKLQSQRAGLGWVPDRRRKPSFRHRIEVVFLAISFLLCLSASATQQATLAWNASASSGATGYFVHYGNASGNYTTHINVGTNTSVMIPGLVEGQTNYFTVTAYDSAGVQSVPSNEIKVFVPGVLFMNSKAKPSDAVKLQFAMAPSHWYEIQATTNLLSWSTIYQTSVSSTNGWVMYNDAAASNLPARYYRLVLH